MDSTVRTPDFDLLVSLHEEDPEAFESFRRRLLQEAIESAPANLQACLQQLLPRMEAARNTAPTPVAAMLAAFGLMQDSVKELRTGWEQAHQEIAGLQAALIIASFRR